VTAPGGPGIPDYVVVGHFSRDLIRGSIRPGGTALYAGVTALRLGSRVAIVTSHANDHEVESDLGDATIARVPAQASTTFELEQREDGRVLKLLARAEPISARDVPSAWLQAGIVHLAPIAWEVDLAIADAGTPGSVVATPQGWLRKVGTDGKVIQSGQQLDHVPLEAFSALVMSIEDIGGDEEVVERIGGRCQVAAITRGSAGCTLFMHGSRSHIPTEPTEEVDSTGAGDVFAAAFFIRLRETNDPIESARFASRVAAMSIEGVGVSRIPTRAQVEERAWPG
jgi:sugar/nucleoside kinase (ribokinase family)